MNIWVVYVTIVDISISIRGGDIVGVIWCLWCGGGEGGDQETWRLDAQQVSPGLCGLFYFLIIILM